MYKQLGETNTAMSAHEAKIFTNYLIQSEPTKQVLKLYSAALEYNTGSADKTDQALLQLVAKNPSLLKYIDAGLALIKPKSEVRRRLYVLFSILESTPDYHEFFLPRQHSPLFMIALIGTSIRAVFRSMVGIVVVKVVAR